MNILNIVMIFYCVYWICVAIFGFIVVRNAFKKYKKYEHITDIKESWKGLVRKDFKKWNQWKIVVGIFMFVPLKLTIMLNFHIVTIVICKIQDIFGRSPLLSTIISLWIKINKKLFFTGLICSLKEEFSSHQKITTPVAISNHSSWLDMYYITLAHGPISFLAKYEVQFYPFLGVCAKGVNSIFVKRTNEKQRDQTHKMIKERIDCYESKNPMCYPLFIFPEGTTSNGRHLLNFKLGAFENKCEITAFCLWYECKELSVAIDEISPLESLFLFLAAWPSLKVKSIKFSPKQDETAQQYLNRVKVSMGQSYGFKLNNGGYRDCLELEKFRSQTRKIE